MWHYLMDYGAFLLGSILCILGTIEDYKKMADANPDPKIVYDANHFLHKEWINLARLLIGGVAIILFMPMLVGGTTVDIKNSSGNVVTTLTMATVLTPFYFLVGYSGVNGLLAIFGKYKNTFMKQAGVE
jgi:hypothetical protein